jgi:hypothetical protein
MLGREYDSEFLRSLDIDFRTAVKFIKDFFTGGGEDELWVLTTVVLAGDSSRQGTTRTEREEGVKGTKSGDAACRRGGEGGRPEWAEKQQV